jgi:hypothetical protein
MGKGSELTSGQEHHSQEGQNTEFPKPDAVRNAAMYRFATTA